MGVWLEYLWFGIKDFSFKQGVCGCMQALCGCVQDCDEIRSGCSCFASAVWICGMRVYVVVQAFCTCGLVC